MQGLSGRRDVGVLRRKVGGGQRIEGKGHGSLAPRETFQRPFPGSGEAKTGRRLGRVLKEGGCARLSYFC